MLLNPSTPHEPIKRPIVVIESPYAGNVEANVTYARACVADSLARGEAPYASHLLYTQEGILNDLAPAQRRLGIDAGLSFHHVASLVVFYIDMGWSPGMREAEHHARRHGVSVTYRSLRPDAAPKAAP